MSPGPERRPFPPMASYACCPTPTPHPRSAARPGPASLPLPAAVTGPWLAELLGLRGLSNAAFQKPFRVVSSDPRRSPTFYTKPSNRLTLKTLGCEPVVSPCRSCSCSFSCLVSVLALRFVPLQLDFAQLEKPAFRPSSLPWGWRATGRHRQGAFRCGRCCGAHGALLVSRTVRSPVGGIVKSALTGRSAGRSVP